MSELLRAPPSSDLLGVLLRSPYEFLDPHQPQGEELLRTALRMPSDVFYSAGQIDERAVLLTESFELSAALRPGFQTSGIATLGPSCSMCVRIGASNKNVGAWVAVHSESALVLFAVPQALMKACYNSLTAVISSLAPAGVDAQVYRTPLQTAGPAPPATPSGITCANDFWAGTSTGPASAASRQKSGGAPDWGGEYNVYRTLIDGRVEAAICEQLSSAFGGGAFGDGTFGGGAFGGTGGVDALEVCAGDGSLAARLLQHADLRGRFASYVGEGASHSCHVTPMPSMRVAVRRHAAQPPSHRR